MTYPAWRSQGKESSVQLIQLELLEQLSLHQTKRILLATSSPVQSLKSVKSENKLLSVGLTIFQDMGDL